MLEIVTRAGCFVFIIALGYILRRVGMFQEKDFDVISTIVLKVTLPAAIIVSFNGSTIDFSMLFIILLGLGCGILYMLLAFLLGHRKPRDELAFDVVNMPGYNIGNFTLPFVQSFLGPAGVVVTSLFDTGNAIVCLGGSYGVASLVQDGSGFSVKRIFRALLHSIPFVTYLIMLALCLLHISLPAPVMSLTQTIANASTFMAMLMIGVGFQLKGDRDQLGRIVKYLVLRYAIAIPLALCFYFLLNFPLEVRQTLVIMVFAPFCTSAPAFTGEMKGNVGLSSALNSISIIISIVCITTLLTCML